MKTSQIQYTPALGWKTINEKAGFSKEKANLVLGFGSRSLLEDPNRVTEIKKFFPSAELLLCSTSGEILGNQVMDDTISCTAIFLKRRRFVPSGFQLKILKTAMMPG